MDSKPDLRRLWAGAESDDVRDTRAAQAVAGPSSYFGGVTAGRDVLIFAHSSPEAINLLKDRLAEGRA